jgi:predicted DNA-binding transcriptional regulator YafY
MAGVPIYTQRGNNGGFSIVDTYKLSSTFMTKTEFDQTITALSAITEGVPNSTLNNVISKLKAVAKNEYESFDIKSGNLIIDAGPWGDTVCYKSKLTVIQKAIEENKKLNIRYHDRNGDVSTREIEPHVIVFKQGLWYVYAYCHLRNEFRFFKTGRIEKANILDQKFARRDLNQVEMPLNFWENNVITQDVLLEIDKKYLSDVEEWLGIENVRKDNDNKYIAEVKLPFDNGLVSKIISYGSGIKVLSPTSLKTAVKNSAQEIINNYK